MINNNIGGSSLLEKISPADVISLNDDAEIVVNRVRINSRLVKLDMENNADEEILKIIRAAIENIMRHEKSRKCIAHGAKMSVGDVKKIFPNIEKMPHNSFVKLG